VLVLLNVTHLGLWWMPSRR